MSFTFTTAQRVVFGPGAVRQLPGIVTGYGSRVFLVLDTHIDTDGDLVTGVGDERLLWPTQGEPTVTGIERAVAAASEFGPDVIVGIGGGSVVDTAKAVGILLGNGGAPLDYLEVVGAGKPLTAGSLPVIAVPTTAGTGAEVTANTPIFSPEHKVKASLRSPAMIPAVALVDPELTVGCPPAVTASAGLDALTQCLEPLTSCKANDFTDLLAREGLRRAALGLRAAYADGSDVAARTDMSMCSLLGGMALANAKLGAVHGLAAPLGGMTGGAHGEVCAAVLAACTRANIAALTERDPGNPALERYAEAARILTGDPAAKPADGIAWIAETVSLLGVRTLSRLGLTAEQIPDAVKQGLAASSMKGNPIVLTEAEVTRIVEESM
ncbi:iron-containing alcohol dehydrogenase [Propionicicella superfundia]|uniref:iron-containing alcohol dehydrogenase n=1 Tax=Propionicicella superfundia TaxID=348582 RepID=UPI0004267E0B|nr:iron-containing alcohol dehydrogenase [Propionicicella superfundia]